MTDNFEIGPPLSTLKAHIVELKKQSIIPLTLKVRILPPSTKVGLMGNLQLQVYTLQPLSLHLCQFPTELLSLIP